MKLIKTAATAYQATLDEADCNRLDFFMKLWEAQASCADRVEDSFCVPGKEELAALYRTGIPVFAEHPVSVDAQALVEDATALVGVLVEHGAYLPETAKDLAAIDWASVVAASNIELAGSKPTVFVMSIAEALGKSDIDHAAGHIAMMALVMALKVQLEKPAQQVMSALRKAKIFDPHPRTCPVCGCEPTLSHVGGASSSSGRGRLLVCSQCGSAWEFERVRCARCGTRNQAHLHYFHIDGDANHRIATCDECGGYMRTLFSEDAFMPVSYEVEDVVMVRLDAVTQDPAAALGLNASKQ